MDDWKNRLVDKKKIILLAKKPNEPVKQWSNEAMNQLTNEAIVERVNERISK